MESIDFIGRNSTYDPARRLAREQKRTRYFPSVACERCGNLALRHVASDRCYGCEPLYRDANPERRRARKLGLKYYVPSSPCERCGMLAGRSVLLDRCCACFPPINRPRDPARQKGRRADQIIYLPTIECGECRHLEPRSVQYDKCYSSTCAPDRYGMIGALAGAAMIGRTTVTLLCRQHGPTQHDVLTGRCLACGDVGHAPR